jgi:hypothetical protein
MKKLLLKGRMTLKELEALRDANELDIIRKMQEVLSGAEKKASKVVSGSKMPRVELRKNMNDIRMLCMIMRDMVKMRDSGADRNNALELAIEQEQRAIDREKKRESLASDEVVQAQLDKLRLSEKIRREHREQKAKEGESTDNSPDQEA